MPKMKKASQGSANSTAANLGKNGPFWRLRDPNLQSGFNEDLLAFLKEMHFTVITVVIDKKAHIGRYHEFAYHPYHYCLGAMLERYCGFLHFNNSKGDVLAESRGGTEDNQLKEAYRGIYYSGTQFRPPEFFQKVLSSKEGKTEAEINKYRRNPAFRSSRLSFEAGNPG